MDAHCNRAAYGVRFHWKSLALSLIVTGILVTASVIPAAEVSTSSEATAAEQLKQLNDQTIINSRVSLDTEWDQFKHGAEKATWTVAGLWAWRVNAWEDWGVRLKLPFAWERSDEASGHAGIVGLGDAEIGTGTAFRLNNTWRTAGGIELHTDTASDPALAEKVWRLKPGWGIAHDFTHWLTLTFNAEYNYTIAEQHNVAQQRYLELSLPGTIILPYDWSTFAKYKTKIDFEAGDRWIHTLSTGVAKRLSNVPLVLSATLEKPLNGGAKNFEINFTMTYYFAR